MKKNRSPLKYYSDVRILSRLRYLLRSKTSGSVLLRRTRRQADERSTKPIVVSPSNHTIGKLQFALALCSLTPSTIFAVNPKFVTHVINRWTNGKVTIKSTDPNAGPVVYKGSRYNNKNDEFNVAHISSINYLVPHELDGKIIITVYDNAGTILSSAALYEQKNKFSPPERIGVIHLEKIAGAVKSSVISSHVYAGNVDATMSAVMNTIAIMIDAQGAISIPRLVTITFKNGTGATLDVGSPDCSLYSIDKAYMRVSNDPTIQHTMTAFFNLNNCKFVATTVGQSSQGVPPGSQATFCFTDDWIKTDQCKNCTLTADGDYVCCDIDPFTGENVCTSEGIVWVRGRRALAETHVWIDYGIIPRKKPQ